VLIIVTNSVQKVQPPKKGLECFYLRDYLPLPATDGKRFRERHMHQNWTDEKLALLRKLWSKGKTATAIAQQLGASKSAVLGKIFRLRLPTPPERPVSAETSPLAHRQKGRPLKTPEKPIVKRGKSLLELTNQTCRWPIGDPSKQSFHFCGEPGADLEQGIPYCERHSKRAYQAPRKSQASAEEFSFRARDPGHRFSLANQTTVERLLRAAVARRVRT
jgi:GcrA cell cycle regulator